MTEAIKYVLIKGWILSKVKDGGFQNIPLRQKTVCMRPPKKKHKQRGKEKEKQSEGKEETIFYEPDVPDLSKIGMRVELLVSHILVCTFQFTVCHSTMQSLVERTAENSHNRWALQLKNTEGKN